MSEMSKTANMSKLSQTSEMSCMSKLSETSKTSDMSKMSQLHKKRSPPKKIRGIFFANVTSCNSM